MLRDLSKHHGRRSSVHYAKTIALATVQSHAMVVKAAATTEQEHVGQAIRVAVKQVVACVVIVALVNAFVLIRVATLNRPCLTRAHQWAKWLIPITQFEAHATFCKTTRRPLDPTNPV
jgi:hypothetical protein